MHGEGRQSAKPTRLKIPHETLKLRVQNIEPLEAAAANVQRALRIVLDRRSAAAELGLETASAVTIEALDEDRPRGVVTSVDLGPRR